MRLCAVCGTCIALMHGNARYCTKCWTMALRARRTTRYMVRKAIQMEKLPKANTLKCVDCGRPAAGYDHRDYANPLDVQPVCSGCNRRRDVGLYSSVFQIRASA